MAVFYSAMEDPQLLKVAILGPTLASMIERFISSPGDIDGFLFGHVTETTPSNLSDDDSSTSNSESQLVATITGFLCSGRNFSFYDSLGRVNSLKVPSPSSNHHHLIGWFSGRRHSPLRPSLREFSVTNSLSKSPQFRFSVKTASQSTTNQTLTPCVFVLLTTPLTDQLIHTHQYRAFQLQAVKKHSSPSLDAKSVDVVNIGPAFRGHYGNFAPSCPLPMLNCDTRNSYSAMNEESLTAQREKVSNQKQLDSFAEGFRVDTLSRLMGPEASGYAGAVEDLYEKMLVKVESLARMVEASSARVSELVSSLIQINIYFYEMDSV